MKELPTIKNASIQLIGSEIEATSAMIPITDNGRNS